MPEAGEGSHRFELEGGLRRWDGVSIPRLLDALNSGEARGFQFHFDGSVVPPVRPGGL